MIVQRWWDCCKLISWPDHLLFNVSALIRGNDVRIYKKKKFYFLRQLKTFKFTFSIDFSSNTFLLKCCYFAIFKYIYLFILYHFSDRNTGHSKDNCSIRDSHLDSSLEEYLTTSADSVKSAIFSLLLTFKFRYPTDEHLIQSGLMTREELIIFQKITVKVDPHQVK